MPLYLCILLTIFATLQVVQSERVHCPYRATSCVCSKGEKVCEFTLTIERQQAFTSYPFNDDGKRDGIGSQFILNRMGYVSVYRKSSRPCSFVGEVLYRDKDFTSRGCTVPFTQDGISNNMVITINGVSPGPTLVVDYNAIIHAHIVNNLSGESVDTSIHWHGMYQRHTAWMDGVGGITQEKIADGTTFDHIFQAKPEGTHWYHSHVATQRTAGLYGALVVRPRTPLDSSEVIPEENGDAVIMDIPEKYTLVLDDWTDEDPKTVVERSEILGFSPDMSPSQIFTPRGIEPYIRGVKPDGSDIGPIPFFSGLINGRGRFQNTITPLRVFTVDSNTYYRFRLVGATESSAYRFSIDNHQLRVIATDGKDIEFVDVDFISVETGERYDFILNANQPVGNYWIRAETWQVNVPGDGEHSARAILSYEGAEELDWRNGYANVPENPHSCTPSEPCTVVNCPFESAENWICISLLELEPRPKKSPQDLPKYPPNSECKDCMHFLNFAFEGEDNVGKDGAPSINAKSLHLPTFAYQTFCGQYNIDNSNDSDAETCEKVCLEPPCNCINVIRVANGANYKRDSATGEVESVIMVFSALNSRGSHPVHMHGHAFHVVHIGYGTEDGQPTEDLECDDPCANPNWKDNTPPNGLLDRVTEQGRITNSAIQKDTVLVPPKGYVVVAIFADNPGYWYLHCHIEGHTFGGMIVTMQEYPPEQQWAPPDGINNPTGFSWNVEDYMEHLNDEQTCADEEKEEAGVAADRMTISRAGFGTSLAIIILFFIACLILVVVLIVLCLKFVKGRSAKSFDRVELSEKNY